ncbi:hypothetical protein DFH09DRAFT_438163 [Mycena vulgaris]|nr:hypothetical protein DFH09DRAFT_438163 [Mycena vulgaris]
MEEIRAIPPIHRLPAEVLGVIFFLTLPLVDPKFFTYAMIPNSATGLGESIVALSRVTRSQSPWLLGQICSHWRGIALSDPTLWSWLVTSGPTFGASPLNTQLLRSKEARLHVCVGNVGGYSSETPRTLAALFRSSERWVDATICINWQRHNEDLEALKGRVGNLEMLEVRSVWTDYANTAFEEDDRLVAFSVAPRLSALRVVGICDPASTLVLPWHQLTRYQNAGSVEDHLNIFDFCPNLVEADLAFLASLQSDADYTADWRMDRLRKLYVSDTAFLGYLSLPALEEIVMHKRDPVEDALLPLLMLTRRDNPPLSSISLRSGVLTAATLTALIEENGAMDTLRLRVRTADRDVLHELVSNLTTTCASGACFATSLRTLVLEIRGVFNDTAFMDMVELRQRQVLSCHHRLAFERVGLATDARSARGFWSRHAGRVAALRRGGLYFWLDSSSAPGDVSRKWRD